MTPNPIVFLVDVDNTLLDNDRIHIGDLLDFDLPALIAGIRSSGGSNAISQACA